MRHITLLVALIATPLTTALAVQAPDLDTDGDGLSDFQELHKYFTDPAQADSDGDWNERREYTHTLTALNSDLLSELDLRAPERMTFQSADGTEVEGWVIPPTGYRSGDGRSWPTLLNMHGGPHGAYGNSFSFDFHLQSGKGFFVLYTNLAR